MKNQDLTEEENKICNEVYQEVCDNVKLVMTELWRNWSNLGLDYATKITNIRKLPGIEKELHKEILSETRQRLLALNADINRLKETAKELSELLSIKIDLPEYDNETMLSDYRQKLKDQISGYQEQVEQRHLKMERLLEWQNDLKEKLGVTIDDIKEVPLPSEEDLEKLDEYLQMLQNERDKRVEIFLNTQMEIKEIMEKLQIKPQTKFEQIVVSSLSVDFSVTDLNMERLNKLRQDLQEKYVQTNNRVLELRERLTKLWECLEEDQIYRDSFLQSYPGCNADTETAIRNEIKRCDGIKKQKIQVFIANIRTKIKLMWDNCMYSKEQREEFVHYFQDIFSEDTLTLHELYLEKITKFYNENKQIFELIVTRKNLWVKMCSLEAQASEPGRYHNRGGRLLQEEKERKTIANNLPKIEAQLRELVIAYETRTGQVFTVEGKALVQFMEEEWELRKSERQTKVAARRQALTPNTLLPRSLAISPLGKRNRTAAGLPHTSEKLKPPSKRPLMTSSAVKNTININNSALKRSAISTIKRRVSGRLAAQRGLPKRILDYNGDALLTQKTPKVNGSILSYKRRSINKRRSRRSSNMQSTVSSNEHNEEPRNSGNQPTADTTTYTDFKEIINERVTSRSSLANKTQDENQNHNIMNTIKENNGSKTPKKTPIIKLTGPLTPKRGKENIQHHLNMPTTPKNKLYYTPTRLTRSAIKLDAGFATPLAPLSSNKQTLKRPDSVKDLRTPTTPNNLRRSKTHTNFMIAKKLPPLI